MPRREIKHTISYNTLDRIAQPSALVPILRELGMDVVYDPVSNDCIAAPGSSFRYFDENSNSRTFLWSGNLPLSAEEIAAATLFRHASIRDEYISSNTTFSYEEQRERIEREFGPRKIRLED
jgi:hypothetical protein